MIISEASKRAGEAAKNAPKDEFTVRLSLGVGDVFQAGAARTVRREIPGAAPEFKYGGTPSWRVTAVIAEHVDYKVVRVQRVDTDE